MLKPRRVELFHAGEKKIKLAMNLMDENLGSICSRHAFHPYENVLGCLNSSGRLHLFKE